MIIILTLDDKNAVSFAGKRQASDRAVADYMSSITQGAPLYIKEKSTSFFKNCITPPTLCAVDSFDNLKDSDVCFMEEVPSAQLMAQAEKLIVFRWNRNYPSMTNERVHLSGWNFECSLEFPGYSHEKITMEVLLK
jgi:hypothetical protein